MSNEIFFSEERETKKMLLSIFNFKLDEDSYIITDSEPVKKVLSRDGKEMHIDDWIGIDKGSLAFVRGSPQEIVRIAKKVKNKNAWMVKKAFR